MRRHRKNRSRNESASEENLVNLTPLIDVVFVLLVSFILIAPLLEIDHIDLADASEEPLSSLNEPSKIRIYVKEDNSIWVNNQHIEMKDLKRTISLLKNRNDHPVPQVFHDRRAQFGTYQTIKNALISSGFQEMDLVLKP